MILPARVKSLHNPVKPIHPSRINNHSSLGHPYTPTRTRLQAQHLSTIFPDRALHGKLLLSSLRRRGFPEGRLKGIGGNTRRVSLNPLCLQLRSQINQSWPTYQPRRSLLKRQCTTPSIIDRDPKLRRIQRPALQVLCLARRSLLLYRQQLQKRQGYPVGLKHQAGSTTMLLLGGIQWLRRPLRLMQQCLEVHNCRQVLQASNRLRRNTS